MIRTSISFVRNKFFTRLFMRFIIGGGAGVLFQFIITKAATHFLSTPYNIPYALATLATTLFNFFFAIKYIFRLTGKQHWTFTKYLLSVVIFYLLNIFMVEYLRVHISTLFSSPNDWIIPFIITTAIMFIIKFLIYDRYVFNQHERPQNP